MVTSTARAFGGPSRYIQGPGEFDHLAEYAASYGDRIFLIIDPDLYEELFDRASAGLEASGCTFAATSFGGECTEAEAARIQELIRDFGADIACGIGGGKTLDMAKLVAAEDELTLFIVPTSASTDAPTSAMSVVYNESGAHLYSKVHKRSADLVLVDSRIIAGAPLRLFIAGIGDALSTYYEARANAWSDTANYIGKGYRRTCAGMAIAKMCRDILFRDALRAVNDLRAGALTEAVENVIEANILLSGLGFENTGCAGAHSVHTGIHEIPGTDQYYHGEMVAFGIVFQLILENDREDELDDVMDLLTSLGLPVTLEQLGVVPDPAALDTITARITDGNSGIEAEPFHVDADTVRSALLAADALGKNWLEE